ncbi:MAG: T9SS C-terminal target domain-containing protein [Bacteroidetes bacterium]|nr:MAG: T9SS C-terminal target domain-containing protein [Bacteroidota bacterium]
MKSIQTTLLLFLLGIAAFGQGHLPKTMTEFEKTIYEDYLQNLESEEKSTQPPAVPPRTPAEFEEAGGLIVTWQAYSTELREIVRHAKLRVPVYIISNNPSSVQSFLNQGGVSMDNVTIVQLNSNSVWVRDYGPQSIYLNGTDELAFVDWVYNRPRPADNMIPVNMSNYLDIPVFQMTNNPNRLIATGGNFMTDGHGAAFSSKLILTENASLTETQIDNIMYSFKGIDRYIKMNELPYDLISHLDMHMKLLDEETLLVAEFPSGVSDGPHIEYNLNYLLTNHPTCYDREYQVVRIPMVPSPSGNYPPNAHYRTFTNSIIINDLVLVPNYYNSALNQQALQIYQQAMPGYEILGIDMDNVISASGAIHCITREIAATDPIFISHATIREIDNYYQNYQVEATIKNVTGLTSASVFYRTGTQGEFSEIEMTQNGDKYSAQIPAQVCNATVQYYISATNPNKTITKPFPGASGPWTFELGGEAVNFNASQTVAGLEEEITFHYLGCLETDDFSEAVWNFGEGANPETASGIEDITVVYNTPGHKTVTLSIDGEELVRDAYILITEAQTYQLTISVAGEGQTLPAPGVYSYEEGSEITLSAQPATGWKFEEWQITSGEVMNYDQAEIDVTMNTNMIAKAVFSESTTSVSDWQNQFVFDIFPNPAQNRFNLVMTPTTGPVSIEVFSITGQRVYHDTVLAEYWDQQFTVDMSNESKGLYFVKVSWDTGSKTRKVVMQ